MRLPNLSLRVVADTHRLGQTAVNGRSQTGGQRLRQKKETGMSAALVLLPNECGMRTVNGEGAAGARHVQAEAAVGSTAPHAHLTEGSKHLDLP